jgi:hydroxyacylglutathione hydrolase
MTYEVQPMSIQIMSFVLGPIENNTFLIYDDVSREAVVIDPSFELNPLINFVILADLKIKYLLITHAHFDHIAGVNQLISDLGIKPAIGLHTMDLMLWSNRGGASQYGFHIDPLPAPDHFFKAKEVLKFDGFTIAVHHTPGHTHGHVVFELIERGAIFCGDVIFANSIGRTDLPGGNQAQLINSIQKNILIHPDHIRLLPGHGLETTVGYERRNNPHIK